MNRKLYLKPEMITIYEPETGNEYYEPETIPETGN